jgi:hypothetical protein
MTTMPQVKYNHEQDLLARRTAYPEDSNLAWMVSSNDRGGWYVVDSDVEDWADVTLPDPPAEEPPTP